MNHQDQIYKKLQDLEIHYSVTAHQPVDTIEDMDALGLDKNGDVCKNLFLRDARGKRHFLVVLRKDKKADLQSLRKQLDTTRLGFASEERLFKYLGLKKGEVTPLAVINDTCCAVEIVIDSDLIGSATLGVHPNTNIATVRLSYDALKRYLEHHGNKIHYVRL